MNLKEPKNRLQLKRAAESASELVSRINQIEYLIEKIDIVSKMDDIDGWVVLSTRDTAKVSIEADPETLKAVANQVGSRLAAQLEESYMGLYDALSECTIIK